MKKFLIFALLCGFVGMPAFADDNEEFFAGGKSYRCGDKHGDFAFGHNSRAQVLGNSTFESEEMGMNRSYLCQAKDDWYYVGTYDAHWKAEGTNWCKGSPITKSSVANADYCIYDENGVKQQCSSQGGNAVVYRGGCIRAECKKNFVLEAGVCVSEEEMNKRRAKCDGKEPGTVENNANLEACKKAFTSGVDAVKACKRTCNKNSNGVGEWKYEVTKCIDLYRVVNAGGVACEIDNNGGNGGGNGGNGGNGEGGYFDCPDGSRNDIKSADNCSQNQTFKCEKSFGGLCVCGRCVEKNNNGGGNAGNGGGNGKQCKYMGKMVNPGHTVNPADVGECKRVHKSWSGSDKIKICNATCEDNGTMRWTILSCEDDYVRSDIGKKIACEKKSANGSNANGGNRTSSLERCLNSRTTDEGRACCYLPTKVATFNGKDCNCVAPNMEFKIGNDGRGQCNAKPAAPGATFNCDSIVLGVLDGWLVECAKNAQIVSIITKIKALCSLESITVDQFNTLYQTLLVLNPGECVEHPVQVIQQPVVPTIDEEAEKLKKSRIKISDSHGALRGMLESFKVSVWKDEEGKFNTARLASDSIAAVVLGTTGALVTSHVVKKNQVENGFEDIKCTIGGQTVADWGDEFRVGIQ